jgi:hypothetical protein
MEPVPLITIDEGEGGTETFKLHGAASKMLKRISGKVAVIAAAGLYRSGKSFLLNKLSRSASEGGKGFAVGHSTTAQTKGLWILGQPVPVTLSNGEACTVIFLDSEGMGASNKTARYDSRIFTLATLLCSCLIYNSSATIDEKSVSNLAFIANITKHVRSSSAELEANSTSGTEEDGSNFKDFFPTFCWVLRDFQLELVDEHGDPITPGIVEQLVWQRLGSISLAAFPYPRH